MHAAIPPQTRSRQRETVPALDSRLSSLDFPRGFTLVELMIVVTVIAILIALLAAVLGMTGQQAKEAKTNATIKKLHAMLEQRMESFDRAINLAEASPSSDADYVRAQQRVPPGNSGDRLKIMVRKQLMKEKFPQRYDDLYAPPGTPQFTFKQQGQGTTAVALAAESAELLYYMLTEAEVGGAAAVDAGEFQASELGDTDGDNKMEFIDAWGNPLRFYRWPTRLIRPDYASDDSDDPDHTNAPLLIQGLPDHSQEGLLRTDPDDPLRLLSIGASFEDQYHTPNTYHVPLIVSAGVDEELGLGEPNSTTTAERLALPLDASQLTDNITNRNQRAGE